MNMDTIIEIIKWVAIALLGFFSLYYKSNATLKENVATAIDKAEKEYQDATKAGGKKFDFAVNWLYELLPAMVRPFITKEAIGNLVQKVFDTVEDYAKKQLDKITEGK